MRPLPFTLTDHSRFALLSAVAVTSTCPAVGLSSLTWMRVIVAMGSFLRLGEVRRTTVRPFGP